MNLDQYQSKLSQLLCRAASLLGEPARPFNFGWDVERTVLRECRRVGRTGLGDEWPLVYFHNNRKGRALDVGADLFLLPSEAGDIRFVHFELPGDCDECFTEVYAVGASQYRRLYRAVRKLAQPADQARPPLMTDEARQSLWNNTLGFLLRDDELLKRYDIPRKRGMLLTGEPGNGKTMSCRWLADQCRRHRLDWRSVTMEQFESARSERKTRSLFVTERPGVILFDDFDTAIRRRDRSSDEFNQSTFLCELDGVRPKSGVVYLFATNMKPSEIDPAMRRPGRIDVVLNFGKPDTQMRRRFIQERIPAEALREIPLEQIVESTDGMSFAEVEESRKLLVLNFLEHGGWDWDAVRTILRDADMATSNRAPIGFSPETRKHPELMPTVAAAGKPA